MRPLWPEWAVPFPRQSTGSSRRLHEPDAPAIVVIRDGRMRGAKLVTFRIFRPKQNGCEMFFRATAHDLDIQRSRMARCFGIETWQLRRWTTTARG